MSLGDAVRSTYRNYANFLGTTSRAEFWLFTLYVFIVTAVVGILAIAVAIFGSLGAILLGAGQGAEAAASGAGASLLFLLVLGILYGIWALATLIPSLACTVRRVRDAGLSGLFVLVILIPAIGNIILFILTLLPTKDRSFEQQNTFSSSPANSGSQDIWG